ncbi:MAG TPA: hypothetical protein VKE69_07840, partial [Planctomycetota bacterium]|nr:hypothetical protein [Planctomycetota bacterium]
GVSASVTGLGVLGQTTSTTGQCIGTSGHCSSTTGFGMRGWNLSNTGTAAHGVVGRCDSPNSFGILSQGSTGSAGQKSFLQPHPTDPSREIRFVCLEGNESGTYFRGSAKLVGGVAVIEVPEEFRLASEATSLTVQLTPSGERASLWTEKEDTTSIVVRGDRDVKFHYLVNGVRRGFAEYEAFHPNGTFVPDYRGVPYGSQYPEAMRRILVENGTLNADYTPNEATAAKLGWSLREADEHPRNLLQAQQGGVR